MPSKSRNIFLISSSRLFWVSVGVKQCEILCLVFSRDLLLMGNVGWATASFSPTLVVSLGCELLLQLLMGRLGSPNALFSRVHVDPCLGRQCCVLEHGFNPFFACW